MSSVTKYQFTVPDMDCEGCVASIQKAVRKLDDGASVMADLNTKEVVVGSKATVQAIKSAIEDAGYEVAHLG